MFPAVIEMSPARPDCSVLVLMNPLLRMIWGAEMVMLPTSLKNDSLAIPAPLEMTMGPVATRETLPPWLPAKTPLWMVAPPVRVSEPKLGRDVAR